MATSVERATNRGRIEHCQQCEQRRQRLEAHLNTFRSRSRVTAHQSGNQVPVNLRVQSRATPGQVVPINASVEITTGTTLFPVVGNAFRDDVCDTGLFSTGIEIDFRLLVNGREVDSKSTCLDGTLKLDTRFSAPDLPGTYPVTVKAVGVHSGKVYASETRNIEVAQAANPPTQPPGGVPGGGGGGGGGGGLLPGNLFSSPLTGAAGVLFLIVLLGQLTG